MGYEGPYSLAARCLSEFLGTMFAIYLGESVIANAELAKTKVGLGTEVDAFAPFLFEWAV
jgi:glycerol uptake facilitator-like aquaporin